MPRIKNFDQQEVLLKALDLFWEKGYNATSLADLTHHMGISKGSFYDTYVSKGALFDLALKQYSRLNIETLKAVLGTEPDVRRGIKKLFNFNIEQALADNKRKGCFMGNSCSELGGRDEAIREQINSHSQEVRKVLADYLQTAKLTDGADPDVIAGYLLTFLAGINQEVKVNSNKQQFLGSIKLALQVLDQYILE